MALPLLAMLLQVAHETSNLFIALVASLIYIYT